MAKNIVIVGGGITGLSAAFYASKFAQEKQIPVNITLIEKAPALGGKMQTQYRDGFTIERGPDSFLARKRPMIDLIQDLNLTDQLVGTDSKAKKTYILHNGELHRIPAGSVLGIPTAMGPFFKTGLISPAGKLRALMDLIQPKGEHTSDESLGQFLERRLGKEVVQHITEPLLSGIYAGEMSKLSLMATFPQFRSVEQKHRSLILGMKENRKNQTAPQDIPGVPKGTVFLSLKGGLSSLIKALEQQLSPQVTVLTGQQVSAIQKHGDVQDENTADFHPYTVRLDNGTEYQADNVILTTPPPQAATLLAPFDVGEALQNVYYVSVANVIMAFEKKDIAKPLDGSGFLVPRSEGRHITACTWTSTKWAHSAPEDKVLVRCYVGRRGDESITTLPEDELVKKVRQDMKDLIGLEAEPLFYEVNRWPHAMPQYPVGHVNMVKDVRKKLEQTLPGVFVTGGGYGGVGLPDCVHQGKTVAEQALSVEDS
ncbi:protoporphyrinogen oxidase [Caldalkalibacillus salinus]|uniref:protoporphyrinogen oxidase n=1 Tax=Caldalkalibacillus salinus TaxID=2803787 RepID=UPI003015BCA2